jgi:beta-galactosidase
MEDAAYYSLTDVIGLHYRAFFGLLDHTIAYVPDRPHIIDEEGLYPSTRGTYQYDKQRAHAGSLSHFGEAMMDAPNPAANAALMPVGFKMSGNVAANLLASYTHPKASGCFVWTALDYIGEPTPLRWPATTSSYGCKDLIGLPKDYYWLLRSMMRKEPLVHAFPHWTWPGHEGERLHFRAYTNCETVEFLVNGCSVARKPAQDHMVIVEDIEYQTGELVVRGYNGGKLVAEHRQVTAGKPARLVQVADRTVLAASGNDVALVRIAVTDVDGNLVPDAEPEITVTVEGAGELVGVHNADPSVDEYSCKSVSKAFNGFLGAYVRALAVETGEIAVSAAATGLDSARITLIVANTEAEHKVHVAADEARDKLFGIHEQQLK